MPANAALLLTPVYLVLFLVAAWCVQVAVDAWHPPEHGNLWLFGAQFVAALVGITACLIAGYAVTVKLIQMAG